MPVPSYRVPVVVARGTTAALTAGLASLEEGEICYSTNEDTLYVVEGGVLTEATGTGSGSLQDVIDDTSPQLGGDLDVNGFEFISTAAGNIVFTPDTTGVVEIKGNTGNDAAIQLNCEANTHGIKLKSPPHSAAASYTLTFPGDTGTTGQALTTDGSGGLSWATPSTVGSIDDLSDVDTTTVAPTDGQALLWDNTAGQWEPGTVSGGGGGAVSSVNTQTGVVSLGIEDLDDFELQPNAAQIASWSNYTGSVSGDGDWQLLAGSSAIEVDYHDGNGVDRSSFLAGLSTIKLSQDGVNFTQFTIDFVIDEQSGISKKIQLTTAHGLTGSGSLYIETQAASGSAPLADGDILQWVDADSKFKPTQLSASVSSIDDLSDVDTSTVAPTDGQALVWDNASSQWEPGTVASSSSIQTATDFELQPATGTTPITRTGASQSSNVTSGNVGLNIQGSGFTYWSTNPDGLSGTVLDYLVNTATFPIDVDISGTTYTLTGMQDDSASGTPNVRLDHDAAVSLSNGVSYTLSLASAPTLALQNNDILQWVDADSVFKPVQQTGSSTRTLLGIGEYADDAAAGTGGVASGALYYNTTNSNYVLKT